MDKKLSMVLKNAGWIWAWFFIFFTPAVAFAQPTPASKDPGTGIRIESDQAIVYTQSRYSEFTGNVHLTIKGTQITADWVKMTYNEDIKKISNLSYDEKFIDTIYAKENVIIEMNDMVANTQEAIYTSSEDTFVLTGENTTITSGSDTIVCDKVTIDRKNQTFKAESTGKTPVEAMFYEKTEKEDEQ